MSFVSGNRIVFRRGLLIAVFAVAILATTKLTLDFGQIANATTAAFSFLLLVLLSAFFGDLPVAITTSVVATLCFNFFYLPPVGTFNIAAFSDWISMVAFLLTAVVISSLTSSAARNRARVNELDEALGQLKEFGVRLLSIPDDQLTLAKIAEEAKSVFSLEYCSIHVYKEGNWHHFMGAAASDRSREFTDRLSLQDHPTNLMELVDENGMGVRYMQICQGSTLLALLTIKSLTLPTSVIGPMAYAIGLRLMEVMKNSPPSAGTRPPAQEE